MHIIGQALRGKSIRIPGLGDALKSVYDVFQLGYNATLNRLFPAKSVPDKHDLDED